MVYLPDTCHLKPESYYDTIIIGAGAAGLMCAIEAGKRERKVLVLDKAKSPGEKIRISGGGRCNFTNLYTSPDNFLSNNPRFCVSALKRFTQHDFISLVKKYNISYHEKTLGQLFCDDSSRRIISMLVDECSAYNVQIQLNTNVQDISKDDDWFYIKTDSGNFTCNSLVIATGGPSIPKMGSSSWGYDIAKKFGLKVISPRAGLVPFTLSEEMLVQQEDLAGVALNVEVSCNKKKFREAMLFTHRGLSGPAILQISSYWKEGDIVEINLAPDKNVDEFIKSQKSTHYKQELHTTLAQILPKRLAQCIVEELGFKGNISNLSNKDIQVIAARVNNWEITPNGTEGFRTAEVTLGGVDTDELSSQTFESRKIDGLYFIGEVVDVTGHLGGFNFQWAWSSGFAAGQYV